MYIHLQAKKAFSAQTEVIYYQIIKESLTLTGSDIIKGIIKCIKYIMKANTSNLEVKFDGSL